MAARRNALLLASLFALLPGTALAGAPAKGSEAAPALDALDFDQGAQLTNNAPGYDSGTNNWSTWSLTDGSTSQGWCSPKGQPTGVSFEWSLDTTWKLDTLVIDATAVQDADNPGIGVKTLELSTGDGKSWKPFGTMQVPRNGKASFPLKGLEASHVRLRVLANHGNKEFSEINEVDLLGTRKTPAPTANVAGLFATNYGPMKLVQDGTDVYGCYDWEGREAFFWGSVEGRIVRAIWWEKDGERVRNGPATLAVLDNNSRLFGIWFEDGVAQSEWNGQRSKEAPTCQPKKKGLLADKLKNEGRVAVYGIRFASGSDVPLPDSKSTIDELVGVLKANPAMKLDVEGHTDSTNSAAYNLDLSERRAKAVVAAMVAQGVGAGRLKPVGFGLTKPVADNGTAQGRALNRRVEVAVQK